MKTRILLFIYILLNSFLIQAQVRCQVVMPGTEVELAISGAVGVIQWQSSFDSLAWNNMIGFNDSVINYITPTSGQSVIYYRAKVTNTTLCQNTSMYSRIIKHKIVSNAGELEIGCAFNDGIVYSINQSGDKLYALNFDQGADGLCSGTPKPGTPSNTNGMTNTNTLVSTCAYSSANFCDTLSYNGNNDWYLPAKDELNVLHINKKMIGGFHGEYISSTWSGDWFYCYQVFMEGYGVDGAQLSNDYMSQRNIRCIRKIQNNEVLSIRKPKSITYIDSIYHNIAITFQPSSIVTCLNNNESFEIKANGTKPFTFQWKKNNQNIVGENDSILHFNNLSINDEGTYTCIVSNICNGIESNPVELKVINLISQTSAVEPICNGDSIDLQILVNSNHTQESGNFQYLWSPSYNLSTYTNFATTAYPTYSTNYHISIIDQMGCQIFDDIFVEVKNVNQNEKICFVSVDTMTNKNKIIWNKTPGKGTQSYNIFKETGLNDYSLIGNVLYNSTNCYIDNNSNPGSHGDKYKISLVDSCGNVSFMSNYYKTMNLTISVNGTTMGLNWDDYIDESGSFVPIKFYIFRGTTSSNISLYDSISVSFHSYNDENVTQSYYYMIGVKNPILCNTGKSETNNFSFSNKKQNFSNSISETNKSTIEIYYNRLNEIIEIKGLEQNTIIELINIQGQIVKTMSTCNKNVSINISNFSNGVYIAKTKSDKLITTKKFLKY